MWTWYYKTLQSFALCDCCWNTITTLVPKRILNYFKEQPMWLFWFIKKQTNLIPILQDVTDCLKDFLKSHWLHLSCLDNLQDVNYHFAKNKTKQNKPLLILKIFIDWFDMTLAIAKPLPPKSVDSIFRTKKKIKKRELPEWIDQFKNLCNTQRQLVDMA